MEIICPHCQKMAHDTDYFCPFCGKKLKDPPLSTSFGKQIGLYLFALLLPPFGIIPAVKYLRADSQKARNIGIVILVLTAVIIIITLALTVQVITEANKVISAQKLQIQQSDFQY